MLKAWSISIYFVLGSFKNQEHDFICYIIYQIKDFMNYTSTYYTKNILVILS